MKLPKETKRYCPRCKKHTLQKIATAKQKARSSAHPLSRGSAYRETARGLRTGSGNKGRRSKRAIKNWKRKSKVTKRITVIYTCTKCKKSMGAKKATRTSRIEIGEKISK